ncbi:MAG: hypothetical protein JWP59_2126, partial [Massilia sp.]|nr:hypothetical protein [Massilia sp.]
MNAGAIMLAAAALAMLPAPARAGDLAPAELATAAAPAMLALRASQALVTQDGFDNRASVQQGGAD